MAALKGWPFSLQECKFQAASRVLTSSEEFKMFALAINAPIE